MADHPPVDAVPPRPRRHPVPGEPAAGTAVTLVPAGDVRLLTGTLLWWSQDDESVSAAVVAGVDIAPTSAQGPTFKVWATLAAAGGDTLVLSADARPGDTPNVLLLSGHIAVREPRRRRVRASAHLDVELVVGRSGTRLGGRTLDLSAAGARIALEPGPGERPELEPGETTEVVIHLDDLNRVELSGHIHTVRAGGQVVVRFEAVTELAVEQIERYVFATLP